MQAWLPVEIAPEQAAKPNTTCLHVADQTNKLSFPSALTGKRLRRNLLDPALVQAQYAVTTPRKVNIMGDDEGG